MMWDRKLQRYPVKYRLRDGLWGKAGGDGMGNEFDRFDGGSDVKR
jgi:hypothetical protein